MILLLDNYDSFTYNLAQYLGQMGQTLEVRRNDKIRTGGDYHTTAGKMVTDPVSLNYFHRFNARYLTVMAHSTASREQLADFPHFGGFLKKSWRCNDLTWGRLDAAEIIARKLLPPDIWKTDGIRIVKARHDNMVIHHVYLTDELKTLLGEVM